LSGDLLDEAAEQVGVEAVGPAFPRLVHQRHGGETVHRGEECVTLDIQSHPDSGLGVKGDGIAGADHGVPEAGRVGEQVADRDVALRRHGGGRAIGRIERRQHLLVAVGGKIARDGIVETEAALLHQHHDGDAGDRLGLGRDAEDRVGAEWGAGLQIGVAGGAKKGHVAVTDHEGDAARQPAALQSVVHGALHAGEPLGREAGLDRLRSDGFRGGGGGVGSKQRRSERRDQDKGAGPETEDWSHGHSGRGPSVPRAGRTPPARARTWVTGAWVKRAP
jgi:hypothetical protein